MIDSLAGTTWTAPAAPLPAGGDPTVASNLFGVACQRSGHCLTWGNYVSTAGNGGVMLLSGAGSSWVSKQAHSPAGGHPPWDVTAVAQVGGTAVALGGYKSGSKLEGFVDVA